jgi:hypothetical protein
MENNHSQNPNYLFRQCCEDRNLPDACLQKCHFNAFTKDAVCSLFFILIFFNISTFQLQQMFFKRDGCPIEAAADMQYCAAQAMIETKKITIK